MLSVCSHIWRRIHTLSEVCVGNHIFEIHHIKFSFDSFAVEDAYADFHRVALNIRDANECVVAHIRIIVINY